MDDAALYRLMSWLSPSYPVGAFAYSHGIEWAVEDGAIQNADSLARWLTDIIEQGGGWSDAVVFRNAWLACGEDDGNALAEIAELAKALAPTSERRLETLQQGTAFLQATRAAWPWPGSDAAFLNGQVAYPVAVAAAAAGHEVPLAPALNAYLHGLAANLISAGVRLVPLGQTDGQKALAALEPVIAKTTWHAVTAGLDDLGGAAWLSDIASMKHETQYTRLFRS